MSYYNPKIEALYNNTCPHCGGFTDVVAIDLKTWEKTITRIAKELHEGKLTPNQLDRNHIRQTFAELDEATGEGFGTGWTGDKKQPPSRAALLMQRNLFRFSGAKNHAMLLELNSKLVKNGQPVSFAEFKKEALKLNKNYNLNYLQAEYQTANQSGIMAAQWEAIQANKELFPNLKYKTQGDDRVGDDHAPLDGIIAPVDSAFIRRYYPPNRFRCRCYVLQTAAKVSPNVPKEIPDIKPEFQNNVGITQQVFSDKHPFFAMYKRSKKATEATEKLLLEQNKENALKWAKSGLKGSKLKNKAISATVSVKQSDLDRVVEGEHKNPLDRNDLIYYLSDVFSEATLVKSQNNNTGNYRRKLYFKAKEGDFYIVLGEDDKGAFTLLAITDNLNHK